MGGRYYELETGKHVALACIAGEWIGRRWSLCEQADDKGVWMQKNMVEDKEVLVNLVEDFFTKVDLRFRVRRED